MSKIDDNREYATLAWDGSSVVPLKVDPITGRLLIEIHAVSSTTPEDNSSKIDENREAVSQVVDDNGVIKPLLVDNRNGFLFVDLLEE